MKVEFTLQDTDSKIELIPETVEESTFLARTAIRGNIKTSTMNLNFAPNGTQQFYIQIPHYKSRIDKCLSMIQNSDCTII